MRLFQEDRQREEVEEKPFVIHKIQETFYPKTKKLQFKIYVVYDPELREKNLKGDKEEEKRVKEKQRQPHRIEI